MPGLSVQDICVVNVATEVAADVFVVPDIEEVADRGWVDIVVIEAGVVDLAVLVDVSLIVLVVVPGVVGDDNDVVVGPQSPQ